MTKNRFIHKRSRAKFSSEKARQMNRARWDAHNARVQAEMPERIRELEAIAIENLPRHQGDPIGCLQWTDYRTGRSRHWIVRIGDRSDRVTLESPGGRRTQSHGWTWVMAKLRGHLSGRKG
jgi:hypothetical protein